MFVHYCRDSYRDAEKVPTHPAYSPQWGFASKRAELQISWLIQFWRKIQRISGRNRPNMPQNCATDSSAPAPPPDLPDGDRARRTMIDRPVKSDSPDFRNFLRFPSISFDDFRIFQFACAEIFFLEGMEPKSRINRGHPRGEHRPAHISTRGNFERFTASAPILVPNFAQKRDFAKIEGNLVSQNRRKSKENRRKHRRKSIET